MAQMQYAKKLSLVSNNFPPSKITSPSRINLIPNNTNQELPEIMDKANQALTYFASGQIPQNSNSYLALNEKKSEMITLRNQTTIGLLLLVILGLLVF